ncbi:hypothetical protein BJ742DRAFT_800907 [Cladochytrium replicatum]|nr:hypothetical protein BJ742DRAFT_800907 [Cladochytrium replicatum]
MSPSLEVRPALSRVEVLFTNQLCYPSWGAPKLSPLEFLDREQTLLFESFADKHFTSWVLVDASVSPLETSVSSSEEILSACETFEREAWVRLPGSPDLRRIRIHAIASVYTSEPHRGKGHASTMIELLRSKLTSPEFVVSNETRPWHEVPKLAEVPYPLQASILYSDIGPNFYAKLGWLPHKAVHTEIDVATALASVTAWAELAASSEQLLWIDASEIDDIVQMDIKSLESELAKSAESSPFAVHFAVPLDGDSVRWHLRRSQFYYEKFASEETRTSVGALEKRAGARWDVGSSSDPFVLWKHDFKDSKLNVLRFRYRGQDGSTEPARALLGAAMLEAYRCGLEKVVYWDAGAIWESVDGDGKNFEPKAELPAGISIVTRTKSSLPSLAYWGPRSANETSSDLWMDYVAGKDIVWLNNEEHAWV